MAEHQEDSVHSMKQHHLKAFTQTGSNSTFNSSAKSLGLEINHSFSLKEADCIYGWFQSPRAQAEMKGRGQSGAMPHIQRRAGRGLWQPGEELPDSVPSSTQPSWVTSHVSFSLPLTQFLIHAVEIAPLLYFVGVLGR